MSQTRDNGVDFLEAAKVALEESRSAMRHGRAQEAEDLLADAEDCLGLVGVAAVVTESDPAPIRQNLRESGEILEQVGPTTIQLTPQTLDFVRAETRWLERQAAEHFVGLLVDRAGEVIGRIDRCDGDESRCKVGIKSVVTEALGAKAQGVIALHNHPRPPSWTQPSGRLAVAPVVPSEDDDHFTEGLRQGLGRVGIALIAHAVVSRNGLPYLYKFQEGL